MADMTAPRLDLVEIKYDDEPVVVCYFVDELGREVGKSVVRIDAWTDDQFDAVNRLRASFFGPQPEVPRAGVVVRPVEPEATTEPVPEPSAANVKPRPWWKLWG